MDSDLRIGNKKNILAAKIMDNHISFVFHENDYKVYNEPRKIRTYHYHISNFRTHRNHVMGPYLMINPI